MRKVIQHLRENWIRYGFETLVVLVGILGAFQLNTWNENRRLVKEENLVLQGLKAEFEQNLHVIHSDHQINLDCYKSCIHLLDLIGKHANHGTIDSLMGKISMFASFDPRMGVVNEVIESGKLGLIRDERLRYRLTQWSGEISNHTEDLEIRMVHFYQYLYPA